MRAVSDDGGDGEDRFGQEKGMTERLILRIVWMI